MAENKSRKSKKNDEKMQCLFCNKKYTREEKLIEHEKVCKNNITNIIVNPAKDQDKNKNKNQDQDNDLKVPDTQIDYDSLCAHLYNSHSKMYECNFDQCRKKYIGTKKIADHIETEHPRASYGSNNRPLGLSERKYLLNRLKVYVDVIFDATTNLTQGTQVQDAIKQYVGWNGIDPIDKSVCFVWARETWRMLLPQNYNDYLKKGYMRPDDFNDTWRNQQATTQNLEGEPIMEESLIPDLERITYGHLEFCQRIQETGILYQIMSKPNKLELVLTEFGNFLNLGYSWTGDNFCPSMIIDLVWHASMLNNSQYNELTATFVGKSLPHCLEKNEGSRFDQFSKQYMNHHARRPLQNLDLFAEEKQFGKIIHQYMYPRISEEHFNKLLNYYKNPYEIVNWYDYPLHHEYYPGSLRIVNMCTKSENALITLENTYTQIEAENEELKRKEKEAEEIRYQKIQEEYMKKELLRKENPDEYWRLYPPQKLSLEEARC